MIEDLTINNNAFELGGQIVVLIDLFAGLPESISWLYDKHPPVVES